MSAPELTVLFDFKDPNSYLALAPTRAMLESLGLVGHWSAPAPDKSWDP